MYIHAILFDGFFWSVSSLSNTIFGGGRLSDAGQPMPWRGGGVLGEILGCLWLIIS